MAAMSEELEVEHFHDYTVATAWEKFTASLEHCLHYWSPTGPGREALAQAQRDGFHALEARLRHRLPFRTDVYTLTLLLPHAGSGGCSAGSRAADGASSAAGRGSLGSPSSIQAPGAAVAAAAAEAAAASVYQALCDQPHKLQEWFGPTPCLLLAPASYSGRILEAEEAHTLLSAAALALAHQRLPWPLLVPVQDALRDGYQGVAVGPGGVAVRLESDSLHTSRLPTRLLQVDDQLRLFASRLRPFCPASSALCLAAVDAPSPGDTDLAAMAAAAARPQRAQRAAQHGAASPGQQWDAEWSEGSQGEGSQAGDGGSPHASSRSRSAAGSVAPGRLGGTLEVLVGDLKGEGEGAALRLEVSVRSSYEVPSSRGPEEDFFGDQEAPDWDADAPWRPWAAEYDPVACLELDIVHRYASPSLALGATRTEGPGNPCADGHCGGSGGVSSGGCSLGCACEWRLVALQHGYERDTGRRGFVLRVAERRRQFLRLQSILPPLSSLSHSAATAGPSTPASAPAGWEAVGPEAVAGGGSFYGMLCALQESCRYAGQAHAVGQLCSENWWLQRGAYLPSQPPEWVLQDMIRDILHAPGLPGWPGPRLWGLESSRDAAAQDGLPGAEPPSQPVGKAAPLSSLFTRFTLHCLVMNSPRAVALLWGRLVRELRFGHWDTQAPLPRMAEPPPLSESPGLPVQQQRPAVAHSSGGAAAGTGSSQTGAAAAALEAAAAGVVDLGACLIHQKLQLLQLCLVLVQQQQQHAKQGQQEQERRAGSKGSDGSVAEPRLLGARKAGQRSAAAADGGAHAAAAAASTAVPAAAGWEWEEGWGDSAPPTPTVAATGAHPHAGAGGGSAQPAAAAAALHAGRSSTSGAAAAAKSSTDDGSLDMRLPATAGPGTPAAQQVPEENGSHPEATLQATAEHAASEAAAEGVLGEHSTPSVASSDSFHSAEEGQSSSSLSSMCSSPEREPRGQEGAAASVAAAAEAGAAAAAQPAKGPTAPSEQQQPQEQQQQPQQGAAIEQGWQGDSAAAAEVAAPEAAGLLQGPGLLHDPSRPIIIPETQAPPPCTEDVLLERELAMRALHLMGEEHADAPRLRARLQGALLTSDMSAFKAANPGACLEDFLRWHSPRDLEGGRLSGRMAAEGNVWRQLWDAAPAAPATQQRPLFDPVLEGERALHFLETLPPALLFADILAAGFSAALGLLGKAPAAALPAVARELNRLREVGAAQLQHGVLTCPALPDSSPAQAPPSPPPSSSGGGSQASLPRVPSDQGSEAAGGQQRGASPQRPLTSPQQSPQRGRDARSALPPLLQQLYQHALPLEGFGALLRMLGCVEHSVAAGQSLLQRLAPPEPGAGSSMGPPGTSEHMGAGPRPAAAGAAAAGAGSSAAPGRCDLGPFAWEAAGALVAAALGQPAAGGADSAAAAGPATAAPAACPYGTAWALPPGGAGRECLVEIMEKLRQREWFEQGSSEAGSERGNEAEAGPQHVGSGAAGAAGAGSEAEGCAGGGSVEAAAGQGHGAPWPRPFLKEWLYEVVERGQQAQQAQQAQQQQPESPSDGGGGGAAAWEQLAGGGGGGGRVRHRMFVKALPAELRVATALSCGRR